MLFGFVRPLLDSPTRNPILLVLAPAALGTQVQSLGVVLSVHSHIPLAWQCALLVGDS